MEIDWSKAPEWATMHGFVSAESLEVWLNKSQYTYVDGRQCGRTFSFVVLEGWGIEQVSRITARPVLPEWNGEGLPPAGTVCEVKGCMSHYLQWNKVTVFAVRGKTVFFDMEDDRWGQTDSHEFRPIRTPEQIAKEAESSAVAEMRDALPGWLNQGGHADIETVCTMLYQSGYRKQVTP